MGFGKGKGFSPAVEPPPELVAEASGPYTGVEEVEVDLFGFASGGTPPYSYAWDLDEDGEYDDSEEQNPSYTWDEAGEYTVGLKVTDAKSKTATDAAGVTIEEAPAAPVPGVQTDDCQLTHDSDGLFCQYWNALSQTFSPDHSYIATSLSLLLTQYALTAKGPLIVKLELPADNCWEAEVLWSQALYSTSLPEPGDYRWITFKLPEIALERAKTYRITVHTTRGWYGFVEGEWVPYESWAAINWRRKATTNPYLRGEYCGGCNYRDGGGSWSCSETTDFAFCVSSIIDPDLESIVAQVGASSDDCYTYGTTIDLTNVYLYLDRSTQDYHAYARFLLIPIPPGATIVSAFIDLCAYGGTSAGSSLRILGIKETNTSTFSTQADADGRPVTDAYVDWAPGAWSTTYRYGFTSDPQNIKAIIQEIVNQPGWAADNALAIKIINTARTLTKRAFSWDQSSGLYAAKLYIEYKV